MNRWFKVLAALGLVASLAACGGSDDDPPGNIVQVAQSNRAHGARGRGHEGRARDRADRPDRQPHGLRTDRRRFRRARHAARFPECRRARRGPAGQHPGQHPHVPRPAHEEVGGRPGGRRCDPTDALRVRRHQRPPDLVDDGRCQDHRRRADHGQCRDGRRARQQRRRPRHRQGAGAARRAQHRADGAGEPGLLHAGGRGRHGQPARHAQRRGPVHRLRAHERRIRGDPGDRRRAHDRAADPGADVPRAARQVLAAAIPFGTPVATVEGQTITINAGTPPTITDTTATPASIVATDVRASNGVIHVIGKVLIPTL